MLDREQLHQLIAAIRATVDSDRIEDIGISVASQLQGMYLASLRQYAPWPEKAPPIDPPRFTRPEHTAISDPNSWEHSMQVNRAEDMVQLRALIGNTSEHVEVQRTGRGDYRVPRSGARAQTFWLEDRRGLGLDGEGLVTLGVTQGHRMRPWGGSDFVGRAAEARSSDAAALFRRQMRALLFEPLRTAFRT